MSIYVVIAPGPFVLGAYTREDSAHLHARCVTGAVVVSCELLESVPPEIRADIQVDEQGGRGGMSSVEWDDIDTPIDPKED